MIGRNTPPPGRIAATASIPGAGCELLHTSHPVFAAVIVITAAGSMRWWANRSRLLTSWAFWLLRIQNWPSGWDYGYRSQRRRMPDGIYRRDDDAARLFTQP